MNIELGRVSIQLTSPHKAILSQWDTLFRPIVVPEQRATVAVNFTLVDTPADWQQVTPASILLNETPAFEDELTSLSVFERPNGRFLLHFHDGAIIEVCPQTNMIRGWLHERLLANGRLEDLTYTALAPLLRRRGFFLVHACGVTKNGRVILFVGPPHSGKTTAGLSLVQQGWQLLGNDAILLSREPDDIAAWVTPGAVNIRPQTFELLSIFEDKSGLLDNGRLPTPMPITDLIFPQVAPTAPTQLRPLSAAEALARLMAASIDRWDTAVMQTHMTFLRALCVQTAVFALQSGRDIQQLHRLL